MMSPTARRGGAAGPWGRRFSDEHIDELACAFVNDHVGEDRARFVNQQSGRVPDSFGQARVGIDPAPFLGKRLLRSRYPSHRQGFHHDGLRNASPYVGDKHLVTVDTNNCLRVALTCYGTEHRVLLVDECHDIADPVRHDAK